jgi:hypothetical protein
MNLLRNIDFVGHSGAQLDWKIDCAALTAADWQWAASRVAERISFYDVDGIPTGGTAFARALRPYCKTEAPTLLIVDDVLTTGNSMCGRRLLYDDLVPVIGVVLFARMSPPVSWIKALFVMPEW